MPSPSPGPISNCCPIGYVYIDYTGSFNDPAVGSGTIVNHNASDFYGTCVTLVNRNFAIASNLDLISCPCCPPDVVPPGFLYSSFLGICIDPKTKQEASPILCIPCNCDQVAPTPCTDCEGSGALPIAFNFNPFIPQCVDCNPPNFELTNNAKLNAFAPYFLIVPANVAGFFLYP